MYKNYSFYQKETSPQRGENPAKDSRTHSTEVKILKSKSFYEPSKSNLKNINFNQHLEEFKKQISTSSRFINTTRQFYSSRAIPGMEAENHGKTMDLQHLTSVRVIPYQSPQFQSEQKQGENINIYEEPRT